MVRGVAGAWFNFGGVAHALVPEAIRKKVGAYEIVSNSCAASAILAVKTGYLTSAVY